MGCVYSGNGQFFILGMIFVSGAAAGCLSFFFLKNYFKKVLSHDCAWYCTRASYMSDGLFPGSMV